MNSIKLLIFITSSLIFISCNCGKKESILNVSSGSIERIAEFPSKLVSKRNVDVWLPDNYNKTKSYSVLYMHDGQMLFDSTITWNKQEWGVDEMMHVLIEKKKIKETIVVGIWNSKTRHSDYFPQKPFDALPESYKAYLMSLNRDKNNPLFGTEVQSDNYLKFLVTELKPYIDEHYATKTDRENTFVLGSSMGGLVSMYALCEYPDVFGGAACMSTHWPGTFDTQNNPIPATFLHYLNENLPNPDNHRIYFDYGTATLDVLYEPYQMQVDSVMKSKSYNDSNWQTLKFEGADHSENSWKKRLDQPLIFLLNKPE